MRMLETERVLLKPAEESDLKDLLELQWEKDLMKHMIFKPLSIENQMEWFKSLGKENLAFTIFVKSRKNKDLVGLATLNQINHIHQRASWGMKLKSNIQSKGIGFESSLILINFAFSQLNLMKIHADVIAENIVSRKLAEKVGTKEEGFLINHYFQNGKFRNAILYGILKEDFYKKNFEILKKLGLLSDDIII
jgi:diamine N-acetyltransferase